MALTKVMDLRTGEVREYLLSPRDAVAAAFEQAERKNWNTWDYENDGVTVAPCSKRPDLEVVTKGNQSTLCVKGWADKVPTEDRPFRLVGMERV